MMKIFILTAFTGLMMLTVNAGNTRAQIDSEAVAILDNMSDVVTTLESCSFVLKTEYDIYSSRFGLIKHSDIANVFLKAPDKILVNKKGDMGVKSFYCDGKTLTYYSADNNKYSEIPALPTIMETIDSIHNEYGVDFPAADVFYPDLVDLIIEKSDNLSYLGPTMIDEKECFHTAGTTEDMTYQFWVATDNFLPVKMEIIYLDRTGNPQFEATFMNWNLNPVLEDSMFSFVIPNGASKVTFLKKNK
jgi:hypothetical protein